MAYYRFKRHYYGKGKYFWVGKKLRSRRSRPKIHFPNGTTLTYTKKGRFIKNKWSKLQWWKFWRRKRNHNARALHMQTY